MNMSKWFMSRSIYFGLLFIALGLGAISTAQAADMTITNLFPANNDVEVCADTKLWITFGTMPIVATDSNMYLQICKVSDDSVVYQLGLQVLPSDAYGPIGTGWPYKIPPEAPLSYEPFAVSGNVLEIYPSSPLDYNTEYYVKMTAGFCTDANSNTSPDINDNTTWRFTTKTAVPAADHDYLVTLDGTGDFCTMQGAVDAVADNDTTRTLIRIKNGNYRGVIYVPAPKTNITWLGEDRDATIISAYNREAFNSGSDSRMVIRSYPDGLRMYNLTIRNTAPDNSGQAETIKHSGQQCIAENCKFRSYQDTMCLNGEMYLSDCYIEGDTDYIWGYGTVYFDKCEIKSLSMQSYITQPRTLSFNNGFIFVDCNLTSPAGLTSCYLGRTTDDNYQFCQSAFIDCTMPETLIFPIGWNLNGATPGNLRWWEYKSRNQSGSLIDVSGRLNPGSRQLTDAEAVTLRDVNNVFTSWNPKVASDPPSTSWQPHPTDGATDIISAQLSWAAGAGATSHMVYFGATNTPDFVSEEADASYLVMQQMDANTTYYWRVDEKNSAGTTTGTVWSFTTSSTLDTTPPSPDPMKWAIEPNATSISIITMTAITATDDSGVEYYFTNVTDSNHDSGWQDSTEYTDNGLDNNTSYTYKVKARDKSFNHNAAADSNEASAVTLRYICSDAIISDLDGDCQVSSSDYVIFADGWLEPRVETEDINNGTFDTELAPWALVNAIGATGTMTATFDGSNGQPAGSALLQANTTGAAVNHHRFYQVIPVAVGNRYRFSGQWSGSLYDPNASSRRNWSEVFIGFSADSTPSTWGIIMYKKRFIATGSASNINFDPASDGTWGWEEITDSPDAGPVNGIFTADQPYMVVSFNLGGNANGGAIEYNVDNISVVECPMTADLNGDCELDMSDLYEVAEKWLVCNRSPIEECWQ
jgi:hypothetical protein